MHHAFDADDIKVAVEHQRRRVIRADSSDDVGAVRDTSLQQPDRKAPIIENRCQEASAFALARRVRREGGISGVDFYQGAGERDRIATRNRHGLPSFRFARSFRL